MIAVYEYGIEAADGFGGQVHQVMACRLDKALLFVACDACGRSAVMGVPPGADFDEDERIAVLGNKVDFAAATAVVAGEDAQSALLQKQGCLLFCGSTVLLGYASPCFHFFLRLP